MENDNKKPYVLVSVFKDDATPESIAQSAPAISLIIDEWHNSGRMIWSGSFDDNKTAMSIIEATKNEAVQLEFPRSGSGSSFSGPNPGPESRVLAVRAFRSLDIIVIMH